MKNTEHFDFVLTQPIQAAKDGSMIDVNSIEIICPSRKLLKKSLKLQQLIITALMQCNSLLQGIVSSKDEEDQEDQEDQEETDEDRIKLVNTVLYSSEIDVERVYSEVERLFVSGCCMVENTTINSLQLEQLSDDDLDSLIGEFLGKFIYPIAQKKLSM